MFEFQLENVKTISIERLYSLESAGLQFQNVRIGMEYSMPVGFSPADLDELTVALAAFLDVRYHEYCKYLQSDKDAVLSWYFRSLQHYLLDLRNSTDDPDAIDAIISRLDAVVSSLKTLIHKDSDEIPF